MQDLMVMGLQMTNYKWAVHSPCLSHCLKHVSYSFPSEKINKTLLAWLFKERLNHLWMRPQASTKKYFEVATSMAQWYWNRDVERHPIANGVDNKAWVGDGIRGRDALPYSISKHWL